MGRRVPLFARELVVMRVGSLNAGPLASIGATLPG